MHGTIYSKDEAAESCANIGRISHKGALSGQHLDGLRACDFVAPQKQHMDAPQKGWPTLISWIKVSENIVWFNNLNNSK